MILMRLDKLLADSGYGSRNDVKKLLKNKLVSVNGQIVTNPGHKADEAHDVIKVDGETVRYRRYAYFLLNKPKGYVSSTDDPDSVLYLIDEPDKNLFPCGRLDKDTTGLLLITNDGDLAHELLSPKHHVEKEYAVTLKDPLAEEDLERFKDGIVLEDGEKCRPASYTIEDDHHCRLVIKEGKYHQIKRMFQAINNEVIELKRIRMKDLVLDEDLPEGSYRELTEAELSSLRRRDPGSEEA